MRWSGSYSTLGAELEEREPEPLAATPYWHPPVSSVWGTAPAPRDEGPNPRSFLEGLLPLGLDHSPKRPLVFLPGVMGSHLRLADGDGLGHRAWPPLYRDDAGELVPDWELSALARLEDLVPDPDQPLVPFVYDRLVQFLVALGYAPGESLFLFGYNWSQPHKDSGRRLAGFIEKVRERTGADAVDLIGHSAGGIAARAAALCFGAPIERVAYLASPHYGAPKAFYSAHPGIALDKHLKGIFPDAAQSLLRTFDLEMQRQIDFLYAIGERLRSCPALYELMPDGIYFGRDRSIVSDPDGPIEGAEATYLTHQGVAFEKGPQRDAAARALAFKRSLGKHLPGSSVLVLYSNAQPTADRVRLGLLGTFDDPTSSAEENGDSTVPSRSAAGPDPDQAIAIPRAKHQGLPNARATLYWLGRFLTNT